MFKHRTCAQYHLGRPIVIEETGERRAGAGTALSRGGGNSEGLDASSCHRDKRHLTGARPWATRRQGGGGGEKCATMSPSESYLFEGN